MKWILVQLAVMVAAAWFAWQETGLAILGAGMAAAWLIAAPIFLLACLRGLPWGEAFQVWLAYPFLLLRWIVIPIICFVGLMLFGTTLADMVRSLL